MPIKPFEFTKPEELRAQQQEKLQGFMQSQDPQQQRLASSQVVVDALFGNPEIKKASAVQGVIQKSQELEREAEEDFLDYEMRKQKYVMENAAGIDPNIAVQANQNLLELHKDRKAQALLDQKSEREKTVFDRETRIFEADHTPIIEKLNPETGQFEVFEVGRFGDDPVGFQERASELQQSTGDQYRLNKKSSQYDIESIAKGSGGSNLFGKSEMKKYREQVQAQTDAIGAYVPLIEMLAEAPQALTNVSMDNLGNMEPGVANNFFQGLEEIGQEAQLALESAGYRTDIFRNQAGEWVDVNEVVSEGLRQAGIESDIAQAKVVGVAYAIAKARDPGGRLSDQDVSLALRSLTGGGGARQIAALFRDQLNQGSGQIDTIYAITSDEPGIIPNALRSRFTTESQRARTALDRLDKRADQLNQPEPFQGDAGESIDLGDGFSYTITGG